MPTNDPTPHPDDVRLVAAALVGEATALAVFLRQHAAPFLDSGVPVLLEGPTGLPVLSLRLELRRGPGESLPVLVVS